MNGPLHIDPVPMKAGKIFFLASSEAAGHPPHDWARVCARSIVEAEDDLEERDPSKFEQVRKLRHDIAAVLLPHFQEVTATMSGREIGQRAARAADDIERLAASTPWEANFAHPQIRSAIVEAIGRNLTTAANHAMQAE